MCVLTDLEIKNTSRTPKYKQVITEINNKIEKGVLLYGEKLPSINELSENYLLSRNTVEKAYIQLKEKGIVDAVKGKGYYVKNTHPISKVRVMLLFNKLSNYKRIIYNAIINELEGIADVDLFIYNGNLNLFHKLLIEQRDNYHYFMVIPHVKNEPDKSIIDLLKLMPEDKLILLDRNLENYDSCFGSVYQDFKMDIYDALYHNLDLIKRYDHLSLVFPRDSVYQYPKGISDGFRRFCVFNNFDYDIVDTISEDFLIERNRGIITISDEDLINLIKVNKKCGLVIGKDFGVISYNDIPFKEILENGITVITTDFEKMGQSAAKMVKDKEGMKIRNRFVLINRSSY